MLSVILTILKIIGIIILVLLGLVLSILLLVLFVPIRYRVKAEHGDALMINGRVSWLMHIIRARIHKTDNDSRIWIRIFGFLVYDSSKEKVKKEKKIGKKSNSKKARAKKAEQKEADSEKFDNRPGNGINDNSEVKSDTDLKIDSEVDTEVKSDIKSDKIISDSQETDIPKSKISLKTKVVNFFHNIKRKIIEFFKKLLNIKNRVHLIISFVREEVNKEAFRISFASLFKLIKHILPTKIRSNLIFGTGDPCSTGQILGILSIIYSFYGDKIKITPDFENKVLKGSHYAKGRIRLWTILIIVIKLLLDKRFKEFKMNYQQLKEAL